MLIPEKNNAHHKITSENRRKRGGTKHTTKFYLETTNRDSVTKASVAPVEKITRFQVLHRTARHITKDSVTMTTQQLQQLTSNSNDDKNNTLYALFNWILQLQSPKSRSRQRYKGLRPSIITHQQLIEL